MDVEEAEWKLARRNWYRIPSDERSRFYSEAWTLLGLDEVGRLLTPDEAQEVLNKAIQLAYTQASIG